MFEWSDIRHFLAVARGGSTLAAAKLLNVNQTTTARRIAALEDALGERLFDRAKGGYRLTEFGQTMIAHAERVEKEAETFERMAAQRSRRLGGVIRLTTNDVLADMLVTPWLGEFNERFPSVEVQTIVTDQRLDLTRGEADIALRAGAKRPEGEGIVIRSLGWGNWGVYCSQAYADKHGMPASIEDLAKHTIIAAAGTLAGYQPEAWRRAREMGAVVRSASSSISHIASSVKSGVGLGPMPCMLGMREGLVPCMIVEEMKFELMLITREEIRSLPHVRAFNDFIIARTAAMRSVIEGPTDAPRI
jgi:DNA-binding transcriptional LysR family regulator